MQNIALLGLTLLTLSAAGYAQHRLPFHSATRRQLWFSRTLLALLGMLFGWVMSHRFAAEGLSGILVFLSAFGVVHVPTAVILFIKRQRHEWR
jgi:hypothetical protein